VDGGIAPVGSFTPVEMTLLVKAFGGDIKKLPKERTNTAFLVAVEDQIRASKGEVTVKVKEGGWVQSVDKMNPPEGFYKFYIKEVRSLDGSEPVRFQPTEFGESVRIVFVIDGNVNGKATSYDGYELSTYFHNPFDGVADGNPKVKVTQAGGKPMDVVRLEKLVAAYSPEIFEYEWDTNPISSQYGINEAENPIAVIADHVKKNRKSVACQYRQNKKGNMAIDLTTLVIEESEEVEEETNETEDAGDIYVVDSPIQKDHPMLCEFANYIHFKCPGSFVKAPVSETTELALSEDGKKWANEHFPEIWMKAELEPKPTPIASIDEEMASKIMAMIWSGESKKEPEADLLWE
jgi:hypothetical protein